jgi:cobalt-zinc-cadmium efflux system membrane fusion protein
MNAEIIGPARNANVIPEEAVMHDGKDHYIFVERSKGEYEKIKVEVGILSGSDIEILSASGINLLQENIVVKGAYTLWMKLKNITE